LVDDFVNFRVHVSIVCEAQNFSNLVRGDQAGIVLVEESESLFQIVIVRELLHLHSCSHELCVVDGPTAVNIDLREDQVDILIGNDLIIVLFIALLNLIFIQQAITILVKVLEHQAQFFLLALAHELRGNVTKGRLLEDLVRAERLHVGEDIAGKINVDSLLTHSNPLVAQGFLCRGTFLSVHS